MSDRDNRVPRRPLPPEVYRRRRVAALVALVLVLALIWWFISSLGSNSDTENTAANSEVTTEAVAPPTGSKSGAKSGTESGSESQKPEESASGSASTSASGVSAEASSSKKPGETEAEPADHRDTCSVSDLELTAKPAKSTFNAGEAPNFYVTIANPTKADCEVDFSSSQLLFEVFRMDNYQRVWGDLDCNKSDVTDTRTIEAGKSVNFELGAWSRTTSAPGQCTDRKPVEAGSFLLYVHVGDNVSEPATFNLA